MITCRGCGRVIDSDYGIYCAECRPPSKVCERCGETYRPSRSQSTSTWARRRWCSRFCSNSARTETRIERIADMRMCGWTDEQIAKELGVLLPTLERYRFRDRQMGRTTP